MRKDRREDTNKYVWISCHTRLEPVYAPLRNGKAHCTACGELWPTLVEGEKEEPAPVSEDTLIEDTPASAA